MTTARTSGEQPGTSEPNRRPRAGRVGPEAPGPQREAPPREGPQREGPQREGPQREGPQREGPQRENGRRPAARPQTPAQRTAEHDDLLRPNPPFPGDDD